MAFAFPRPFPFETGTVFARASGPGSCHASAQAFAGPCFGRRSCQPVSFRGAAAFEFDLVDTPAAYFIYFDATGFNREDVHVKVTDRTLKLSARKGNKVAVEKAWSIPEDVQVDDISAKFLGPELTVTLPRIPQEPKASFDVPIHTGPDAASPASVIQEPVADQPVGASGQVDLEQEADGSWVEVADEDVTRAKEKGKASTDGHVLEDAEI